ncbi:hypothetical protein Goari_010541 [Gossypium aridum]|uniref:Uncharacterized protein n=1 Tax=Gossypium aridum TaxID=34290 RepID=A0A7J8Y0C3_GOSAI|nr:hypothetical protein [Gossypium aridum]
MWNNRYEFLPTPKPIFAPELAYYSQYILWFRVHGKPYLLGEEARGRTQYKRRPQQVPMNPRRRGHD